MPIITFNNELPTSVSVRYRATDGTDPLQHVNAHHNAASLKPAEVGSTVKVTVGDNSKTSTPLVAAQPTLRIRQGAGNDWYLQWV